ncbi:MAG: response regulator [Spirochaetes bacterium]|nr:response regulator [Spirochaetota bacterium]
MKILIVDDSQVMRNIHKNSLLNHNVPEESIIEAKDGDFAMIKANHEDIDLFLVDWNMPGLNGLEFTQKLRKMEKYKETPIIMITSEAAKYNVVEAIKAGVTNYIVKPVNEKNLWEKIGKFIT